MSEIKSGSNAKAVTPSDTADIAPGPAAALFIGGAGNIRITPAGASKGSPEEVSGVLFAGVPVGWFPMRVRRVWSANTTCANINAIFE
jgi:hypothetical protein